MNFDNKFSISNYHYVYFFINEIFSMRFFLGIRQGKIIEALDEEFEIFLCSLA